MTPSLRRNIELKARYADLDFARKICHEIGAKFDRVMEQTDTYFRSAHGRLKLREYASAAELIWYERPDGVEYRGSDYYVVPVADAALLNAALSAACGVRGVVRKHRELFLYHNLRIHLDRVEELGNFIEFEAVMGEAEDERASRQRLDELHRALKIRDEDHESGSYSDLMGI